MKTIRITGGTSWISTVDYYTLMNQLKNYKSGIYLEIFCEETKEKYLQMIYPLIQQGAEEVIYACTEIPILLHQHEVKVTTFDTTPNLCKSRGSIYY